MIRSLAIIAVLSSVAAAQPGTAEPVEPAPQPPTRPEASVDIDAILARVEAASPTLESIARGAFRRARRSISIGPTVGFWGGGVLAQDEAEYALTFGIGLERFKVPVLPTMETFKQLVMERAKARLKEQIVAQFRGQTADPLTIETFAREVWEQAVQEVLGLENVRPRTMERPALSVGLELNRHFELGAWSPRVRLGVGIGRVTLAGSLSVPLGAGDYYADTPLYLGLEVAAHFLMSKNPRASVFDVFVRTDFEVRNRDTNTDLLVLGVRYLLDVL